VPTDLGDEGLFEVERGMEAGSMVVRHPGYGHTDGVSESEWAGGFATEAEAKEARDSAHVASRQAVYFDKGRITVMQYLDELARRSCRADKAGDACDVSVSREALRGNAHRAHAAKGCSADDAQRVVP
jgi:hypothetical protein